MPSCVRHGSDMCIAQATVVSRSTVTPRGHPLRTKPPRPQLTSEYGDGVGHLTSTRSNAYSRRTATDCKRPVSQLDTLTLWLTRVQHALA